MLLKAELAEGFMRIDGQDLLRSAIGKKRNGNRDQAAHQMRVAVAAIVESVFAGSVRFRRAFEPNLADAAPHLVDVVMGVLAQGLQSMTQLDDIAIPILPLVERGKILAYGVDCGQGMRQPRCVVHDLLYGGARAEGQRAMGPGHSPEPSNGPPEAVNPAAVAKRKP
jgi:hypothetical protein